MLSPQPIRLLLVDDHPLLREGMSALLTCQPDIEVVGEAGTGEEAVDAAARLQPDIVVMDIAMPGMDGIQATRRVKEVAPQASVLMLTMYAEERYLVPVVEAGASGYILKTATHEEFLRAVRTVAGGQIFLSPEAEGMLLRRYVAQVQAGTEEGTYRRLSVRERDVLKLVAEGYTSSEIAQALFLSSKTVDSYRERVAEKLGFQRRADFVHYALRLGLLQPPEP